MRIGLAALAALAALLAAPAAAQTLAPIHPNDLNAANARERSEQIRRDANPAAYGQMNALDSLRLQSDNMNDAARRDGSATTLAPIPPERRDSRPLTPRDRPGDWPGYKPGYLPRQ